MKKILTFSAIAMFGLFAITGCTKKSDSPSYTMKATIGSTTFSGNMCTAHASGSTMAIVGWTGSGTTATAPYLSLTINTFTGAATYTIDTTAFTPAFTASYWPDATVTNVKFSQTGSIVVSSSSSTSVSGTFNFKCTDGTTVSGGTFTAKVY